MPHTAILWMEVLFIFLLGLQVIYFFVFSVAGLFFKSESVTKARQYSRIAVLIPGFKEDAIIVNTALKSLEQSYPRDYYQVLLIADGYQPKTLHNLAQIDVNVLEVAFETSTKGRAINAGLEYLSADPPELVVVLDSDNIMATDFLERVNAAYQAGVKVIQGHRTAKNRETSFAFLDALNEEIGNSIFRRGHRALGFSSATIGSAMAFEFPYYRHLMLDVFDTAGEDKVMELKILKEKRIIHYLDKAVVYDEKVSTGQKSSTQRKRWVAVQLEILASHWKDGVRQLFMAGNLDYFDKVFQLFLIPKVILIGLLAILGALAVFGVLQPAWVGLAILYYTALLLAVPGRFYTWQLLQAIGSLPMAIIYMFRSIIGLRPSGSSKFEVTKKTKQ